MCQIKPVVAGARKLAVPKRKLAATRETIDMPSGIEALADFGQNPDAFDALMAAFNGERGVRQHLMWLGAGLGGMTLVMGCKKGGLAHWQKK